MRKRSRMSFALGVVVAIAPWFALCCAHTPAAAQEQGIILLANAAKHAGDRVIQSGEFTYTRRVTNDPPTQEEIKKVAEQGRAVLGKTLKESGKKNGVRVEFSGQFENVEASIAEQLRRKADREWRYRVALRNTPAGAEWHTENTLTDPQNERERHSTYLLARPKLTLFQRDPSLTTIGSRTPDFGQKPSCLGRLVGLLVERVPGDIDDVVRNLNDTLSDVVVRRPDGESASNLREISCCFKAIGIPRTQIVIHVDPSRDYITPLVREADEKGRVLREWVAEDYFQPEGSEIWFPQTTIYRLYDHQPQRTKSAVDRYTFARDGVALNSEIPPERFTIALQRSTKLTDSRSASHKSYKVVGELKLSLDALDELGRVKELDVDDAS